MSDMQQRIEALYRSDVRGSVLLIVCLWATILFVLFMTWPYIPDSGIKVVVAIAAAAVLIFNTAAILAMVNHYKEDKDFIYGLDIKNADAIAQPQVLRGEDMARYTPPEQSKAGQVFDIVVVVVAIFVALWLPLKLGLAGAAKSIDKIDATTWEALGQNATMASIWEKLGYTPETAHDIIQNRFHYIIDWPTLIIMAVGADRLFRLPVPRLRSRIPRSHQRKIRRQVSISRGARIMWIALSYACLGHLGRARAVDALRLVQDRHDLFRRGADLVARRRARSRRRRAPDLSGD